jgi:hypothetical protein
MNKEKKKFDINNLKTQSKGFISGVLKYKVLIFVLFIALVYGFVWIKINGYNNAQPSTQQVDSQVQAAALPHIDQKVLKQIQSLQDNSVSVQALFNQARNNPFSTQ